MSQESARQKDRRLQSDRAGPFFTGFLAHSYGYGPANPAKTVLAGVTFRFDVFCRADSQAHNSVGHRTGTPPAFL